jgi:hypothetical protein
MATIGGITVPEIPVVGTFPLTTSYPHGRARAREVVVHRMGGESANGKIEQRYYLGDGATRFTFRADNLTPQKVKLLADFWMENQGQYGSFYYNAPNEDGTFTEYVCRFAEPILSFEYLTSAIASVEGLELVEIPDYSLDYASTGTVLRIPSGDVEDHLRDQVQFVIPLIRIQVREPDYPVIYLSDRRVTIDEQEYQPRLLEIPDGIEQNMFGASEQATFMFGNADKVMTRLTNDVNLFHADIRFSFYHHQSAHVIEMWRGDIQDWKVSPYSNVFQVSASDGLHELNQLYPRRKISRRCWKKFDNAANGCPAAEAGTLRTTHLVTLSDQTTREYTFAPTGISCDKGWDTPNGCLANGMERFFGAIVTTPQAVRTKDNSTGVKGYGRATLTSASMVADSIYGEVVPEIYANIEHEDESVGFPVNCKIVSGRDEGDFYTALGVIGEGPIEEFATPRKDSLTYPDGSVSLPHNPHKLDGQDNHGWTEFQKGSDAVAQIIGSGVSAQKRIQSAYGIRLVHGEDPVLEDQHLSGHASFSLGEGGDGINRHGPERAAGTAFAEMRRNDEKGLQLSRLSEHSMQIAVRKGHAIWTWTDNGDDTYTRSETREVSTNPIWIAVNAYLKMRGAWFAGADEQEELFDVTSACAAASICDLQVPKLIGTGEETQFTFTGISQEAKPGRDWLQEILNNCLGYYTFRFSKIAFGIRSNSSAVEQWDDSNTIYGSLEWEPLKPSFWQIQGTFADEEYGYISNTVEVKDETYEALMGDTPAKSQMNFAGLSGKSPVSRVLTTRLREELGGWQPNVQKAALRGRYKTTLLGLTVEPGMVCRFDHAELPDYPATVDGSLDPEEARPNHIQFRVERWRLNKDCSIDVEFRTVHNEIYDLVAGPKPEDVEANILPQEELFPPGNWRYYAYTKQDGKLRLNNLAVGRNGDAVHQGFFDIYYRDEARNGYGTIAGSIDEIATEFDYSGPPPVVGDYIQLEGEIMKVDSVVIGGAPHLGHVVVQRGQLGTQAVAHTRRTGTISAIDPDWPNLLTVDANLDVHYGERIVRNEGDESPEQQPVTGYDPASGELVTALPMETIGEGDAFYTDARLWLLKVRHEQVPFQTRFFRSPHRAKWEHEIDMPGCGIALIRGRLTNTRGVPSETVVCAPVSSERMQPAVDGEVTSAWPHAVRTHDNLTYQMPYEDLTPLPPASEDPGVISAFEPVLLPEAQTCKWAYAEIVSAMSVIGVPIDFPPTPAIISVQEDTFASITITGEYDELGEIHVKIVDENELSLPIWRAQDHDAETLAEVAASLCAWLNNEDPFASYYLATVDDVTIRIVARTGHGGVLALDYKGGIIPIASGRLVGLGITKGRRYAIVYQGDGLVSSPSPLSASTGPAISASAIEIAEIPIPGDERVDEVLIYATPDGEDWPLYLIDTVDAGTVAIHDEIAEADLTGQAEYAGPSQPGVEGHVYIEVKKDGNPLFDLFIRQGDARSNVVDGYAIAPLEQGIEITGDLKYRLTEEPSQDRPGFPIDLRLVIE